MYWTKVGYGFPTNVLFVQNSIRMGNEEAKEYILIDEVYSQHEYTWQKRQRHYKCKYETPEIGYTPINIEIPDWVNQGKEGIARYNEQTQPINAFIFRSLLCPNITRPINVKAGNISISTSRGKDLNPMIYSKIAVCDANPNSLSLRKCGFSQSFDASWKRDW